MRATTIGMRFLPRDASLRDAGLFGGPCFLPRDVSPTVRDRLSAIHDLDVLGQLTEIARDCQSLAEFETALDK